MLLESSIQKTSNAKPKNFWQRTRFFSDSQRFPKAIIFRDCKSTKSSSGKVHLAWLHPLRSGKGPQLPGSNWKPLLIFIIIVVSVLKGSIHLYSPSMVPGHSVTPHFPWDKPQPKPQNITMKNTQKLTSYTRNYQHRDVCLLWKWGVKTLAHTVVTVSQHSPLSRGSGLRDCSLFLTWIRIRQRQQ